MSHALLRLSVSGRIGSCPFFFIGSCKKPKNARFVIPSPSLRPVTGPAKGTWYCERFFAVSAPWNDKNGLFYETVLLSLIVNIADFEKNHE
jgi:hypothetical protein